MVEMLTPQKSGYPPLARPLSEAYHSPCKLTNKVIPTNLTEIPVSVQ